MTFTYLLQTLLICFLITSASVAQAKRNVTEFGAIPNDGQLDTAAIQAAFDSVGSKGGEIVFPKGTFSTGALLLRSGLTLTLLEGAVLKGSDDARDYALRHWRDPLMLGDNLTNVCIQGKGTIDGSDCKNPRGEEGFRGPHCIHLRKSRNILIQNIRIRRTGNYAMLFHDSAEVIIRNVTVRGGHDGVHAQNCRKFRISDCDIRTGDDCFAGCDNVDFEITNCQINTSCNGFRLGCVNLLVKDCRLWGPGEFKHQISKRTNMLSAFVHFAPKDRHPKLPSDQWRIEGLTIENVGFVYGYNIERGLWQKGQPAKRLLFRDIKARGIERPIRVLGDVDRQFDLTLENVFMELRQDRSSQSLLHVTRFGSLALTNVTLKNNGQKPVVIAENGDKFRAKNVECIPKNPEPFKLKQVDQVE